MKSDHILKEAVREALVKMLLPIGIIISEHRLMLTYAQTE